MLAFWDGKAADLTTAKVSVLDRGFLFGDGAYEVVRVYQGKLFLFEEHLERFARSLRSLRIDYEDFTGLRERVSKLVATSGLGEATVYFQVTRGAFPVRTHAYQNIFDDAFPSVPVHPSELVYISEVKDAKEREMREGAKAITYDDIRWARCDIKSINLLGNVFAAQAAKEAGVYDTILIDSRGLVTEGSHTNVFAVIDGVLRTHPATNRILHGITREAVLRIARESKSPFQELAFSKGDLARASEVFFTGTTTEVMPVIAVDGVKVGNGAVGALTAKLQDSYRALQKS